MIDCLIIGDSIARGVAQAAPLECSSLTHVGINSREFNRRYNTRDFIAKTVVISLGSNDYRGIHTQRELRAVRARVIGKHVIERIQELKTKEVLIRAGRATRKYKAVKSDGPDDLVFQSVVKGAPMRDNNILVRHIKPAARQFKIGWVNWQVLRRSCATWLQQAGVDVKDAQGILRHSRASTTQDIYQQLVPESQITAVRKLTAYAVAGRVLQ